MNRDRIKFCICVVLLCFLVMLVMIGIAHAEEPVRTARQEALTTYFCRGVYA